MFYCRADRDIRKERAPRNSQGKATQRKRTHETNNYCSCLRNGCAFGVCANKDHQDPTSDHDATSDHANEHLKNCNRDGDRIHGRQNDRCAPSPIVVQSSPNVKPMSYVLGRKVRYVDKDGRGIDPHLIRPGTRVHLDFDRTGAVKRVVVVERE